MVGMEKEEGREIIFLKERRAKTRVDCDKAGRIVLPRRIRRKLDFDKKAAVLDIEIHVVEVIEEEEEGSFQNSCR